MTEAPKHIRITFSALCLCMGRNSVFSAEKKTKKEKERKMLDKIEKRICEILDERQDDIIAFGEDIWHHAELGYKEVRTSGKFVDEMKKLGFDAAGTDGRHSPAGG